LWNGVTFIEERDMQKLYKKVFAAD